MPTDPIARAPGCAEGSSSLLSGFPLRSGQLAGTLANFVRRLDNKTIYDLLRDLPEERFDELLDAASINHRHLSKMEPPDCNTCHRQHWPFMVHPEG